MIIQPKIVQFTDKTGGLYELALKDLESVEAAAELATHDECQAMLDMLNNARATIENKLAKMWMSKQKHCK